MFVIISWKNDLINRFSRLWTGLIVICPPHFQSASSLSLSNKGKQKCPKNTLKKKKDHCFYINLDIGSSHRIDIDQFSDTFLSMLSKNQETMYLRLFKIVKDTVQWKALFQHLILFPCDNCSIISLYPVCQKKNHCSLVKMCLFSLPVQHVNVFILNIHECIHSKYDQRPANHPSYKTALDYEVVAASSVPSWLRGVCLDFSGKKPFQRIWSVSILFPFALVLHLLF